MLEAATHTKLSIAVFEGDGIGPEIMAPTLELVRKAVAGAADISFTSVPAGAAHFARYGESLPAESLREARNSDAILLSAMGLPSIRYPNGTEISPQIDLRMELGLYAGVRPVMIMPGAPCPLKDERAKSIDFVLIRESTEGLFSSHGKGTVTEDYATETLKITRDVSERLFDFSFRLAQKRKANGRGKGMLTCVDKANVFKAFAYFRSIFEERAKAFPDITTNSAYVDATALWMVERPWTFDVLVTENMFGDILSDLGAGLMGSLGLAPSADIGDQNALFQPCHGSAPDIAGKGLANPLAMFLSAAMMLDWLGDERGDANLNAAGDRLEQAVRAVLADGTVKTRDLGGSASTDAISQAVADKL